MSEPFSLPVSLRGSHVTLEPLSTDHDHGLRIAVSDGELWKQWTTLIPSPDGMRQEIERRLALQEAGNMLPFALRRLDDGRLCGMTSFMDIDRANRRLEIGSTWLSASAQRTAINTEAKLMLLTHAFEVLACIAVEFRTHWMNHQSRDAILRLGAKQDGVLRNHRRMPDGTLRDTVVYSIIDGEWPTVKRHLEVKLRR